jgi:DNA-binding MarR family transcriptional regulator
MSPPRDLSRLTSGRKVRLLADAKRRADPSYADFALSDSPFYLLVRTAGQYELAMANALRAIGMDLPSWRALMIVHEHSPTSVSEIAAEAVTRLSTMTRVVQRLEQQGLVKLAQSDSDARVTQVSITVNGERAALQVREVASQMFKAAFGDATSAEIAALNQMLRRLHGALAKMPKPAAK